MIADLHHYAAYKPSGVEWLGDAPEHWEVRRLATSVRGCINGVWGNEPNGREDLPCVRVADFDRERFRARLSEPTIRAIAPNERNRRLLKRGDLLLEKSGGGDSQPVGVVMLYDHDVEAVCSNFVARMPVVAGHNPSYLTYLHSHLYAIRLNVRSINQTTGIQNIDSSSYLGEAVAFAPLPEQTAIVRYLGHVDRRIQRYIRAKRKLIGLLEEEKQAIINRTVTRGLDPNVRLKPSGVDWLGDVPEHWEVTALRHRYSQSLGKMLDTKRIVGDHLLPYLRNTDVQWDHINVEDLPTMDIPPSQYDRYTVLQGDLLVCEGGEVGRSGLWSGELTMCGFQKALHRLRPTSAQKDMPRFMYYALRAAVKGHAFSDGHVSTIGHLTGDKLRAHRFPFPPLVEQIALVEYLDSVTDDVAAAVARARRQIDLVQEYRTRLIADVVTGKLDVREAAEQMPDEVDDENPIDGGGLLSGRCRRRPPQPRRVGRGTGNRRRGDSMTNWETCPAVESVPGRLSGAWVFTGTRVPVSSLFGNLAEGATLKDFLEWFPGVE